MADPMFPQGIILEFVQYGKYVRVNAVDPMSGLEVSIVGDPSRPRAYLEQVATQKLRYVMTKKLRKRFGE